MVVLNMKKAVNVLLGAAVVLVLAAVIKLVAEACSPCMHKYFEVEKD